MQANDIRTPRHRSLVGGCRRRLRRVVVQPLRRPLEFRRLLFQAVQSCLDHPVLAVEGVVGSVDPVLPVDRGGPPALAGPGDGHVHLGHADKDDAAALSAGDLLGADHQLAVNHHLEGPPGVGRISGVFHGTVVDLDPLDEHVGVGVLDPLGDGEAVGLEARFRRVPDGDRDSLFLETIASKE